MKLFLLYLLIALTFVFATALPRRPAAHDEYADAFDSGEDDSSDDRDVHSDEYADAFGSPEI